MEFTNLITARYSCKKFNPDCQITAEQLNAILEAGRVAPTAKNLQEQHIYVIQSPELLALLDTITPCRYNAPTCLVVAYNKNDVYTYPGGRRTSGTEDASIVATHMLLAAKNAGVDSCWVNCFDPDKLHAALNLPEHEDILMIMDLGIAAEGAAPMPTHASCKPLSETVTYL